MDFVGYVSSPELMIVTKLYANGPLSTYIRNTQHAYDTGFVHRIAVGIATGLALVHRLQIVHYDLKPANVLLDEGMEAVVADFGVAKVVGTPRMVSGMAKSDEFGFTPAYAAPELFFAKDVTTELDKKADVYAFGITLWELLTRRPLWQPTGKAGASGGKASPADIKSRVMAGERPLIDEAMRTDFAALVTIMEDCWRPLAESRPTFDQVRKALLQIASS